MLQAAIFIAFAKFSFNSKYISQYLSFAIIAIPYIRISSTQLHPDSTSVSPGLLDVP